MHISVCPLMELLSSGAKTYYLKFTRGRIRGGICPLCPHGVHASDDE